MNRSDTYRWFRRARPAGSAWNLLKTFFQTAIFWTVFLLLLPIAIFSAERALGWRDFASTGGAMIGWLTFSFASCLGLASGYTMATAGRGTPLPIDCPRRLVTAGPYRYVRNPMAIAGLSQAAAIGVAVGSWGILLYVFVGALLWDQFVKPVEEEHLAMQFGSDYEAYRGQVRCWVPRRHPYHYAPPS